MGCVDLFVMADGCMLVREREMKMTVVMIFGGSFEEVVEIREISTILASNLLNKLKINLDLLYPFTLYYYFWRDFLAC